jgi:mitochondrial-processing peptidase subunit alpha
MHNATAYNHAYADSGVFCVHASAHPSQLRDLVDVITREFVAMAGPIEETDLNVIFFYDVGLIWITI